jgi:hypothetical protein
MFSPFPFFFFYSAIQRCIQALKASLA